MNKRQRNFHITTNEENTTEEQSFEEYCEENQEQIDCFEPNQNDEPEIITLADVHFLD